MVNKQTIRTFMYLTLMLWFILIGVMIMNTASSSSSSSSSGHSIDGYPVNMSLVRTRRLKHHPPSIMRPRISMCNIETPPQQQRSSGVHVPYLRRIMSGVPREYAVVGYLHSTTTPQVYPLYGRASRTNTDRWNYYTVTDRLSNIRLPLQSFDGRDCTADMGCDELHDGQHVNIPGVPGSFQVRVYNSDFRLDFTT